MGVRSSPAPACANTKAVNESMSVFIVTSDPSEIDPPEFEHSWAQCDQAGLSAPRRSGGHPSQWRRPVTAGLDGPRGF